MVVVDGIRESQVIFGVEGWKFGYRYIKALWIQIDCDPEVSNAGSHYFTTPKGGNHLKITFLAVSWLSLAKSS